MGAGRVAQVDNRNVVAVFFSNGAIIPCHVPLRVRPEPTHSRRAGVLNAGVEPVSSFTNTRRANHHGVNVPSIHHGNSFSSAGAANNNSLGERLSIFHGGFLGMSRLLPPALRGKGNVPVHSFYLSFCGPTCGTVLPITNRFCLDVI